MKFIVAIFTLTVLAACERNEAPPSLPEAADQQLSQIDPMANALKGATLRWLEAHYPGREFTFSDLTISRASGHATLCGTFTYSGNSSWREYFTTSPGEVKRFGEARPKDWQETCAAGEPVT